MTTDTPLDDYAKRTPGEWAVRDGNGQYAYEVVGKTRRGKDLVVARVGGGPLARGDNARLIADAPKLLQRARTLERDLAECRAALRDCAYTLKIVCRRRRVIAHSVRPTMASW